MSNFSIALAICLIALVACTAVLYVYKQHKNDCEDHKDYLGSIKLPTGDELVEEMNDENV